MIYFAVDQPRIHLLDHYLAGGWGRSLARMLGQVSYPELFRSRSLARGAWIFTSLDALSEGELEMVARIQSAAREAGLPVLNDARKALHRYELLQALWQTGCNEFRAFRATGPLDSLRFPVFVREANEHDGSLTPLLHNHGQLRRAIAYLRLRGLRLSDLLVIEFCETAGGDGIYRKYSIFRVGNAYLPRYLHVGPHWMTKEGTRSASEDLVHQEIAYLRDNPHVEWVREVFELAQIEYGRLDYGVRQGRPQAWEINLTPLLAGNPHRGPESPEELRFRGEMKPSRDRFHTTLRAAFRALDPGPLAGEDLRLEFPPAVEEQARRERQRMEELGRRKQRISRIAAAPGFRRIGALLRRVLRGE